MSVQSLPEPSPSEVSLILPPEELNPITLTPNSFLIFPDHERDWREQLFELAANRAAVSEPSHKFWRTFANELLANICRLPDDANLLAGVATPPPEWLEELCGQAPPMPGGEYLSSFTLAILWLHLSQWVAQSAHPSLSEFMAHRAPLWKMVGRVTFHLAENKADTTGRPFGFLVTYVNSLNSVGEDKHMALSNALKQYAGQGDHPALLSLLTPVKVAAERLPWVAELVNSKDIYRGLAFSINKAHRFLMDIPALEESGLTVKIPDWWRKRPKVRVMVQVDGKSPKFSTDQLMDWDVGMAVGNARLTKEETEELFSTGEEGLVFFKGQWLEVNRDKLKEALDHWEIAKEQSEKSGLTFIQAMRLLAGLPPLDKDEVELPDPDPWVLPQAGPILEGILNQLKKPEASEPPEELLATLRPYQKEGLSWLSLLAGLGLGACLADDMGLGKTMQVLALLLLRKKRDPKTGPALLVAPASLLANWKAEASKFAPTLKLATWHPSETPLNTLKSWEAKPAQLAGYDLVISSYGLVSKKIKSFLKTEWGMVILDEAQAIKNPTTGQSRALKTLKSPVRLALTGTPIENRLIDLWSLFDFLNPGLLGSLAKFNSVVAGLAQSETPDQYRPIRSLVAPYLLRRLKSDKRIIKDLPDKTEIDLYCHLTPVQVKLYSHVVNELAEALKDYDENDNKTKFARGGLVLQTLTRLKQVINHPAQLTGDMDWDPQRSGKFLRLAEICKEMAERQERLLVFTQYMEIIGPLASHLAEIFGAQGLILHGSTKVGERQKLVSQFQADNGPPFFVLSLKAGGTGLNLTAAGQVIHFDRWWNPAVEDQATDRAYRIGQLKNVLVHKCVTRGTLEDRINELLKEKRNLASDLLDTEGQLSLTTLDNKALLKLVSLDIDKAQL
ncbi:MAG: DEAD/DEAH box helicase [Deltaproteobacteria bacterium]|jgi:non-specific serine/threonine protein kinase|nr:DEAD/DEAH box helicase [Deltaproteobacteria bacterium]